MQKAKSTETPYILEDEKYEQDYLDKIRNGEIDKMFNANIEMANKSQINKYKFVLRNKLPNIYRIYQKLRYLK